MGMRTRWSARVLVALFLVLGIADHAWSQPATAAFPLQSAATANGVGQTYGVSGSNITTIAISGTFAATITLTGSQGPSDPYHVLGCANATDTTGSFIAGAIVTAPGLYRCVTIGIITMQAPITGYISGAITVLGITGGGTAASLGSGGGGPVTQGTTPWIVTGRASDNSTTDSGAKAPVLPCRANANAPPWTEGMQVPCSENLSGAARVTVPDGTLLSNAFFDSTATNNATNVTAAATTLGIIMCTNSSTTVSPWLKVYNKATLPAPATDTTHGSVLMGKFQLAVSSAANVLGGFVLTLVGGGLDLPAGFGYALVTNQPDNDNTALAAANAQSCNFFYRLKQT